MNNKRHIGILLLLFFGILSTNIVYGKQEVKDKGGILILSSYNPDIKRMSGFISDFESAIMSESSKYEIFVEDLNFKGIEESSSWKRNFQKIYDKYATNNLKAVILLGQESWATFLSMDCCNTKVPFFGCIASENGIYINEDSLKGHPQAVDFNKIADTMGHAGGALNRYDVNKNIKLIKTIYQDVKNIALISDNTYGGIALQSLFIAEMKKENELTCTLLDARDGTDTVEDKIANLPENSVIILGTWRIGNKGQYLMYSSLNNILSLTDKPVFTISGVGFGALAVGGVMPVYDNHAKEIAKQIISFYNGDESAVQFIEPETEYRFDNSKLEQYGIKTYQLPKNSIITDSTEAKLQEYKKYITVGSIILAILILFTLFITFLYIRNKRLQAKLKVRELELIAAKEKAEESNALKTAFLANMSHEIRTPLNAIAGFSAILCDKDINPDERNEYGSIIKSNTEMLLTLINDILDISRLQATDIAFNNEDVDVVTVMQEVIFTTQHKNTIGLNIVLDTELSCFMLNIDRKRLSQVLINLMTNAYKFTKEGGITLSFRVTDNTCMFSVTDTGMGIPLDLQNKVFERFEKVNEFGQGTGLGLAICRQIVTKFGGKIGIDSTYTQGARFVFTIPF